MVSHFEQTKKDISAHFETIIKEAIEQREKDFALLDKNMKDSKRTLELIKFEHKKGYDLAAKHYQGIKDMSKTLKTMPYEDFYKMIRRKK